MKIFFFTLILSMILYWHVPDVSCEDASEEAKIYAVQNRIFHRNHEIDFDLGYIANEDFFHPFPIGFGYTYSFSDNISWEVARAQYIISQDKDLKSDLEEVFGVTPSEFAEPTYMIHSHLMFKPFYGKNAVMNKGVINHETYFFIGGGLVNYEWQYPDENPLNADPPTESVLSASFGVGSKYFINQKFCLNFEIRDIMNFWDSGMENRIYVGVGLGFRFNLRPRKLERDELLEELLKNYLKNK